jgi:hypothetical protein
MDPHENEGELAQLFDKLFPLPEGEKVPMPRFGRTKPPPAQYLPATGGSVNQALSHAPVVPLQWIDDTDLGIRVFIEYEADPPAQTGTAKAVWAKVVSDDPGLAGKSASVALLNEKGDRSIGRLIPLKRGPDDRCTGELCFGTVDEVRAQLGSEKITLDVFLME